MPRELEVSARNQWFQTLETLKRNRSKRHRLGQFLVEGVRSINLLHEHERWGIEALAFARGGSLSTWAQERLRSSRAKVHLAVDPSLMEELSDKDDPSELLAVARIPEDDLDELSQSDGGLYVVADRITYPGNLGTLVRSCDALGVDGLVVFGRAADLYDPRSVRASAGSLFSLTTVRVPDWQTLEDWLTRRATGDGRFRLVGSSAHGDRRPDEIDLRLPTVLVIGNETRGISRRLRDRCDQTVTIPMRGSASSLNAACAATALLAEVARQRAVASEGR